MRFDSVLGADEGRRRVPRRTLRLVTAAVVVATSGIIGADVAAADPTPPSAQDVRDARRAVDAASRSVAEMELRLAQLSAQSDAAQLAVQKAGEDYTVALAAAEAAKVAAADAVQRSADADARAEDARRTLVAMAREAARSGGNVEALQAVLSADGFRDVARRSTALEQMTGKADEAVQEFRAAQLVASVLADRARTAEDDAKAAEQDASAALATAQKTQQDSDAALVAGAAERDQLISALAAARQTSAELERARQDALEADRRARADEAARQAALRPPVAAPPASSGGSTGSTGGSTGSAGGSTGGSTGGSNSGSTGGSNGGSTGGGSTGGSTGGGSTGGGSTGGGSTGGGSTGGGSTGGGSTAQPTTPPSTGGQYGLGTGRSRGSAGGGAAAVEWARTQLGKPYIWGGVGPEGYDCSGLTGTSWRSAGGVSLNRTSRDQYKQVLKISYDQLRPGDLVFWSTDPSNPDAIHHVAIWAGNGQIIEAPTFNKPVRLVAMRWAGTMPYAGRP
ncbi:NlpC/P60 family protein [Cellulomonas sp. H30R-01]|uniref:C40 family peptidase n=1 Tax=Cellulomonas sp. H30R-01 TaxID=2704467 RepID=UPI001EE49B40|nr:NlpC/P60 family protein [Cellulomonas sp. H30R-01]